MIKIKDLEHFRCYAANDNFPDVWGKSISIIFPQLAELTKKIGYTKEIINVEDLNSAYHNELSFLFNSYGSDKSTKHNYHYIYSHIFGQISVKNLIEIGLGTNNTDVISNMTENGKPGASLRAFSQFLADSNIYGADIDKRILFNEDRIQTYYVDQMDIDTFSNIPDIKYDLIIDDGLHQVSASLNTLIWAIDRLSYGGFIVIEDIIKIEPWITISYILESLMKYQTKIIRCRYSYAFLAKKC